jgi:hypothetical protein
MRLIRRVVAYGAQGQSADLNRAAHSPVAIVLQEWYVMLAGFVPEGV